MAKWTALLLLCIAAISCSRGAQEGGEKGASADYKAGSSDAYVVRILPELPSAADSIIAEVRSGGKGKLSSKLIFVWERNGQRIEGINSERIEGSQFKRGDIIRVGIIPEGGDAKGKLFYSEPRAIQNAMPVVSGIKIKPDKKAGKKDTLTASAEAKDADGDPVSVKYQWLRNGAEEIEGANSSSLSPVHFKRGDFISVRAAANDGIADGKPMASEPVAIINTQPEIVSQPPAQARGYEYRYKISTVDLDSDALRYSLTKSPSGMTIDSISGEIRWNITDRDEGMHNIEISVDDGNGGKAVQGYTLTIRPPR